MLVGSQQERAVRHPVAALVRWTDLDLVNPVPAGPGIAIDRKQEQARVHTNRSPGLELNRQAWKGNAQTVMQGSDTPSMTGVIGPVAPRHRRAGVKLPGSVNDAPGLRFVVRPTIHLRMPPRHIGALADVAFVGHQKRWAEQLVHLRALSRLNRVYARHALVLGRLNVSLPHPSEFGDHPGGQANSPPALKPAAPQLAAPAPTAQRRRVARKRP